MGNTKDKLFAKLNVISMHASAIHKSYMVLMLLSLVSVMYAQLPPQGTAEYNAMSALCSVYNPIVGIIFILALVLIVLGGALFAGSNMLPAQTKGQIQSYGMSMIIGGVIGIVIYLIAPFMIGVLGGTAASTQIGYCSQFATTA
jgi:hypothetical protein